MKLFITIHSFYFRQHVIPRRSPDLGHEHSTTLHESPLLENSRTSGEQQLLRRQHQYWSWRFGVVRRATRILGRAPTSLS